MSVFFIAEAGVNHNGSFSKACKLIDIAADAGADFIKFQHTNPSLISKKADLSKDQSKNLKKKIPIKSIKVKHGKVISIAYIFDKIAYVSDCNDLSIVNLR